MPAARALPITSATTTVVFSGRGLLYGVNIGIASTTDADCLIDCYDGTAAGGIHLLGGIASQNTDANTIPHADRRMFAFPQKPVEVERTLTVVTSVSSGAFGFAVVYFNTETRIVADIAMLNDRTANWSVQEVMALANLFGG